MVILIFVVVVDPVDVVIIVGVAVVVVVVVVVVVIIVGVVVVVVVDVVVIFVFVIVVIVVVVVVVVFVGRMTIQNLILYPRHLQCFIFVLRFQNFPGLDFTHWYRLQDDSRIRQQTFILQCKTLLEIVQTRVPLLP